jgi:hypothetical protein
MKQIVVFDDDEGFAEGYVKRLLKLETVVQEFKINRMSKSDFEKQLSLLRGRREETRSGKKWTEKSIALDEVSILIVDFDLLTVSSFLTGEEVAYLARCYSKCGLIVGLNLESRKRFSDSYFDLTLKGHPESFCDLNIDSAQLDNPRLWMDGGKGFRPWYWPHLPKQLDSIENKVQDVMKHLKTPIVRFFHFDKMLQLFPSSTLQFLGGNPAESTFKDFVNLSGNGLRGKDIATEEMIGRIGSSRVSKWLERLVLPGQDILVDAPHLVSRFPSILKGNPEDVEKWNKTATFSDEDELGLNLENIDGFTFKPRHWLSRPAWFWNSVYSCGKIKEVTEPWNSVTPKFAFCEDSSTFEKKEDCKEFYASIDSPYNRRFIHEAQFPKVDYAPKVLLL